MSLTRAAGRSKRPPFPRLDDGLRARADAEAETPRCDLVDAGRAHGQRRRTSRVHVRNGCPHAHLGRHADHGQRREAVEAVHLERPGIAVAFTLSVTRDVRVLGEREPIHRHRQGPSLASHARESASGPERRQLQRGTGWCTGRPGNRSAERRDMLAAECGPSSIEERSDDMLGDIVELSVVVRDIEAAAAAVRAPLRPQGAPPGRIEGVRVQECDPAHRNRTHRPAPADRPRQGR